MNSGIPPAYANLKSASKGVFKMECEVTSSPSAYGSSRTNGGSPGSGTNASSRSSTGSAKSQLHVDFLDNGEVKEKREKYLTAKYGSHQMSLIRKRLSVEMWLYDELQKLFEEYTHAHYEFTSSKPSLDSQDEGLRL
ncbi:unnamed protein product [Allacma fusca]|uniref:Uncharacterized protein n=1 Tax=Allacma fusca TaxID=39272 RepID=A0A8J2JQH1_9HEXA|nr:unnamed protein product [Allacma fusca]